MPDDFSAPDPARLDAALALLGAVCEPEATVADLGCLHGAYTLQFAYAGYHATGIDARPEHIRACWQNASLSAAQDGRLEYVCDDVRNLEQYGPWDATFACGLLYHLDRPREFLALLGKMTRKLLILNTHYAVRPGAENEGLPGIWYDERGRYAAWSAFGNDRSFWLAKPALLAAIQDSGFSLILEVHDHLRDIRGAEDRIMLAAVKT